jgi:hypothetical protein
LKRISIVLAVAFGLAVATFAGLWNSHGASAAAPVDGQKCYKMLNVETDAAFHGSLIYISDQFQEKDVIIRKPLMFCDRTAKANLAPSVAGGSAPHDLVCYDFRDAPGQSRFRPVELLARDQFNDNFLTLTKPYALCEAAEKGSLTHGTAAGGFNNSPLINYDFVCYRARRNEHGDRFEKIDVLLFDQFDQGGKDARLGRPVVFCTQLFQKKLKAKNDHIDHATFVDPPRTFSSSTVSATNDRSDPPTECASHVGHTVWFTYTPSDPVKVNFSTNGSSYDTVLSIYEGDPSAASEVACNDDDVGATSGLDDVKLEANTKYFIMVGSYGFTSGGKLKLSVVVDAACVSCVGRIAEPAAVDLDEGEAAAPQPQNLTCYSISQRAPQNGGDVHTDDQLRSLTFDVGRGTLYCERVTTKCVFDEQSGGAIAGPSNCVSP